MKRYLAHLRYTLEHKVFVFAEGRRLHVPLGILIFHDWDKFIPWMFVTYARSWYDPSGKKRSGSPTPEFGVGWLEHMNKSKHHWQHWIEITRKGEKKLHPIPEVYLREMVADWRAFSRSRGTKPTDQYEKELPYLRENIHPDSFRVLDHLMGPLWQASPISMSEPSGFPETK